MRCVSPKLIWPHRSVEWTDKNEDLAMLVPCGKCVACLVSKRNEWTFRLGIEHRYAKSSLFVTLTYDQKHLPSDGSVSKYDLQCFFKRLRKNYGVIGIRYYAVGEYGSKSGRPHYHIILFNCDEGAVRKAWIDSKSKPIGIVHVGKVSAASIAYVTKYVIQRDEQELCGRERPFALMSRAYGIGGRYLDDDMVLWHRNNEANYVALPDNQKGKLPRFYRDKIWYREEERARVSLAARELALSNQVKEDAYYRKVYGERGPIVKREFAEAVLARVKQKVSFSQTF